MGPVRLEYVVSFSSQDDKYPVNNLLHSSGQLAKGWHSSPRDKSGLIEAEFQLEKLSYIHYVDIGNFGSSTVELLVRRSSWSTTLATNNDYVSLLPAVSMMTYSESKGGANSVSVRMFTSDDLNQEAVNQKWDRVKIICSQPFRKDVPFGISFLRLGNKETESASETTQRSTPLKEAIRKRFCDKVKSHGDLIKNSDEFNSNGRLSAQPSPSCTYSRGKALLNSAKKIIHPTKTLANSDDSAFETNVLLFLTSKNWKKIADSSDDCMLEYENENGVEINSQQARIFKNVYKSVFEPESSVSTNSFYSKSSKKRKERDSESEEEEEVSFDVGFLKKVNCNGQLSSQQMQNGHLKQNDSNRDFNLSRVKRHKDNSSLSSQKDKSLTVITIDDDDDNNAESCSSSNLIDEFVQFDGSKPGTSKEITYMDCPICSIPYHVSEIEAHAATCDKFPSENSDDETPDNEDAEPLNCHPDELSECPVCGNMFQITVLPTHANICMENCLA